MNWFSIMPAMLAALAAPVAGASDAFYVWQQEWSSNVLAAVTREPPTLLYPLAATVPSQGDGPLVGIPWEAAASAGHRLVPVIRIPLGAFQRPDIDSVLTDTARRIIEAAAPRGIDEIQLDLDCPERLLPRYAELIGMFRRAFPGLRLSITALPAHLGSRDFNAVARAADSYVLQVHGLDVPRHIDDPAALLDPSIADRAIRQAEKLGRPYRIALPCYAYELNFDPGDGRFLFLTAEGPGRRQETLKRRICARSEGLLQLIALSSALEHADGITWFRLPVDGDRLCLPRGTLEQLRKGSLPEADVECRIIRVSDTTLELELFNANTIHAAEALIRITWPQAEGSFDLYQQVECSDGFPGHLPPGLTVPMPPPGQSVRIGWFQSDLAPSLKILLP